MNKRNIGSTIAFISLVILAFIFVMPFYLIVVNSFKPEVDSVLNDILTQMLLLPSKLDLQYIINGYQTINFGRALIASLFVTTASVICIAFVSSMAAWMLVRVKTKMSSIVFYALVSAILIPFQSLMFPLVKVMSYLGLDNIFGLVFMYMGFGVSLSTFLFHGFIKSVPLELEEAAMIDGVNMWQMYYKIVLPMLKPILITTAVLNVIWIWNDFMLPYLILKDVETIPLAMMRLSTRYSINWSLYIPVVLLSVIPAIVFYFSAQKHIVKGIASGAIK